MRLLRRIGVAALVAATMLAPASGLYGEDVALAGQNTITAKCFIGTTIDDVTYGKKGRVKTRGTFDLDNQTFHCVGQLKPKDNKPSVTVTDDGTRCTFHSKLTGFLETNNTSKSITPAGVVTLDCDFD